MVWKQNSATPGKRNERHSAAWGKHLSLAVLLLAGTVFGQQNAARLRGMRASDRLDPEVTKIMSRYAARPSQQVKVIVQYKQAPKTAAFSRVQNMGGRVGHHLGLLRGAAFTVPAGSLQALANDPEVAFVSLDHPLKSMDDYSDAAMNVTAAVNAAYDGTGIGVADIDSGVNDNNSHLSKGNTSRVLYHQDFTGTTTYLNRKQVWDLYGHGTHAAGIIGGNGNRSNGRYAGVAPNVNLIDFRVLDANGAGSDSQVIAAIQQAIALKNTYNIRVINLSLGRGIFAGYAQDRLCQAVESAWRAGIVVVAAAGITGASA
jgi:serine protease AprX